MGWTASSESFISSFDIYLLNSSFVPGSILGTGDTEVNKERKWRNWWILGQVEIGRGRITRARGREHVLGATLDVVALEAASGSDVCADTLMTTESRQCPGQREL